MRTRYWYKTVESIPTQTLENFHEADEKYPLTLFASHLRPLYQMAINTDPKVVEAEQEFQDIKHKTESLPEDWQWHDYQPEYPHYRELWKKRHLCKDRLTAIRREAGKKLKNDSKRQREILLVEVAQRRLRGIK